MQGLCPVLSVNPCKLLIIFWVTKGHIQDERDVYFPCRY